MIRSAVEHHRSQAALSAAAVRRARAAWALLDIADLDGSWRAQRLADRLFVSVSAHQLLAAQNGAEYVGTALAEQGIEAVAEGDVNARSLVGVASDGRSLESLLYEPLIAVKSASAQGSPLARATAAGEASLIRIVQTQVADAGRIATSLGITARPRVGWVRMLNPPSCSRCAVLAGKHFGWNQGFQRHPHCDCTHIPASESTAGDLTTNPRSYFDSLNPADQDRYFTKSGAQAIRDGADIGQVVNARRGMSTTVIGGQKVTITSEGVTRRGFAGKRLIEARGSETYAAETVLRNTSRGVEERVVQRTRAKGVRVMPETIYDVATDRADALRLLRANGFIA